MPDRPNYLTNADIFARRWRRRRFRKRMKRNAHMTFSHFTGKQGEADYVAHFTK